MSEIKNPEKKIELPSVEQSPEQLRTAEAAKKLRDAEADAGGIFRNPEKQAPLEQQSNPDNLATNLTDAAKAKREKTEDNLCLADNTDVTLSTPETLNSTKIDDKVTEIEKERLPHYIQDSFANGDYRTVVANEDIKLYRTFGGQADAGGAFATTERFSTESDTRQKLALLPEWGNTCKYEAEITVPQGEKFNLGKVEKQTDTYDGTIYKGGGDQVLLPQNWFVNHPDWITDIRVLKENDYE